LSGHSISARLSLYVTTSPLISARHANATQDFPTDGDDLLFERIFLAIEHRLKGQPAERNVLTDNLEPLAKFLIRRAQLKGPYELLGRDPQPSEEWKQYEEERLARILADREEERTRGVETQLSAWFQRLGLTSTPAQQRLATPQHSISALRSTATAATVSFAPLPIRQHSRISPRTSPIDHLLDPRLLYALPGQYISPNLPGTLTVAEDQHHRRNNLEFQQFLTTRPAHESWGQHQHMLTQAAATLYDMARADSQGSQGTGSPSQDALVRDSVYSQVVSGRLPSQIVFPPPSQTWAESRKSVELLVQQNGVVRRGMQAPNPPGLPAQPPPIVYLNPRQPWTGSANPGQLLAQQAMPVQRPQQQRVTEVVESSDSLQVPLLISDFGELDLTPLQKKQRLAPTANMYAPPQQAQRPPQQIPQPFQQATRPMRLMEPRRTLIYGPVPSQLAQVQPGPVFTTRKPPPTSLPTMTKPAGISKPKPQASRTPATPRMSIPDQATWNTLTKAEKIALIWQVDQQQKADDPSVITTLDEMFARHMLEEERKTKSGKGGVKGNAKEKNKKKRSEMGEEDSPPPTFSVPVQPMPRASSFGSTPPTRKDYTKKTFKIKGYQNHSSSAYMAPPNGGSQDLTNGMAGSVPSSDGAQTFQNHPGFSNIVGGFPAPRFHELPEVRSVRSQGAGEMG
jgi:hypothetical protein